MLIFKLCLTLFKKKKGSFVLVWEAVTTEGVSGGWVCEALETNRSSRLCGMNENPAAVCFPLCEYPGECGLRCGALARGGGGGGLQA